jgi:hypothetical protein
VAKAEVNSAPGIARRRSFGREVARFFALTLRQPHEDSVVLTASALAFVTAARRDCLGAATLAELIRPPAPPQPPAAPVQPTPSEEAPLSSNSTKQ